MKIVDYIIGLFFRIIALPLMIGIIFIFMIKQCFKHIFYWTIFGGESIAYQNFKEIKQISDVYYLLKERQDEIK